MYLGIDLDQKNKRLVNVMKYILLLSFSLTILNFCAHHSFALNFDNEFKHSLEREIYNGFQEGPQQVGFEYPVNSEEWLSIVSNHPFDDMSVPHVAWKTSGVLNGFWYSFLATDDNVFLFKAYEMLLALLKRRDHIENRPAWNGKIYPLWGSNSRYHGGFFSLFDVNGNIVSKIEVSSTNNFNTLLSIKKNNDQTLDLCIERGKQRYFVRTTVKDLPEALREVDWTYYGSPFDGQRAIRAVVFTENANLSEVDKCLITSVNVPSVVHQGIILDVMVKVYISLKRIAPNLASNLLEPIYEILDTTIDLCWQDGESCFFSAPQNSPTYLGGGEILPWNQQASFVSALAIFGKEEGIERYLEIVDKWCSRFKEHWEITDTGVLWRYWEEKTGTVDWYEATHYAYIVAPSVFDIYKSGRGFSENDIENIAKTIKSRIIRKSDFAVAARINGKGFRGANRALLFGFLDYLQYAPEIFDALFLVEKRNWANSARLLYAIKSLEN